MKNNISFFELPLRRFPIDSAVFEVAIPYELIAGNMTDDETYHHFIGKKYNNCHFHYTAEKQKFTCSIADDFSECLKLTELQRMRLQKEMATILKIDMLSGLKKCLCFEEYIVIKVDLQNASIHLPPYIPQGIEEILIYGYDDVMHVFKAKSVSSECCITTFEIKYEDISTVIYSYMPDVLRLNFWKYTPNNTYKKFFDFFVADITDYINSANSLLLDNKDKVYGMAAIEALIAEIKSNVTKRELIQRSYVAHLVIHKWFLLEKITYMVNNSIIDSSIKRNAEKAYSLVQSAFEDVKAYNGGSVAIAADVVCKIEEMLALEQYYLPEVLKQMKEYVILGDDDKRGI